ncbi:SMP-30/gluconolactonase/LRE family protein [Streptomonospora litoralis]|uniref:SMP-30/Gluconolaconase/LRE-like region n=1 Tax=Streptomonospora litoralis TaxID=2498135 RepID=A0A4P6Q1C2_9ACTN|nr:SMP-30/gluconolactonase/LRE family protein [Streptomonospora litoralis]QBI53021.1 SMP-30/Gluconolaconase/LRE-like region [Streptomonospora litoralis]
MTDVRVFARGLEHPETVAIGPDHALYAGTARGGYQEPGPVVRIDPDTGDWRPFADTGGRVLGITAASSGLLVCCDALHRALLWLDPQGRVRRRVDTAQGRPLMSPNGCIADRYGGVWFTDSGTATAGEPTGAVGYAPPHGDAVIAARNLVFPNGIGLSPDGSLLYTTLTRDETLLCHEVHGPGRLGTPWTLNRGLGTGPDGLSVTPEGEVVVAVTRSSRVCAVSPTGEAAVLLEDPGLLHMPSHVALHRRRLLVPSLFGDTIAVLDRGSGR